MKGEWNFYIYEPTLSQVLCTWSHLNLTTILQGKYYYFLITDEENEAQGSKLQSWSLTLGPSIIKEQFLSPPLDSSLSWNGSSPTIAKPVATESITLYYKTFGINDLWVPYKEYGL